MLQRLYRLPSRIRFQPFHTYRTPFFIIRYGKNNLTHSRFGFIISKKVAKSAVDRNRSRRKVRSGIEIMLNEITPGYDFLFLMKKNLKTDDTREIHQTIKKVLSDNALINHETR